MTQPVQLLDTTLRDGSYEVRFQFTPEDTALIVSALDRAGVSYIELCHGSGFAHDRWLNYNGPPRKRAAATDEAHLEAAAAVVERAQLGVVFVVEQGFVTKDDMSLLARLGAKFVRLMFLPGNIFDDETLAFVTHGKELGLTVSINLMQTYALPVADTARAAKLCAERGADWFYVVDSAGGMLASEVRDYVRAVGDSGLRVGLHAHNNLGLALSNALVAVEAGATLVDATLQGMGRNTGNPATEQLVLALQALGHEKQIDRDLVLSMGDLVRTLMNQGGNDPTDFVFGASRLSWRQIPRLVEMARSQGRSARDFLFKTGEAAAQRGILSANNYPQDLLDKALGQTASTAGRTAPQALVSYVAAGVARSSKAGVGLVCDDLTARAGKRGLRSVLHLVPRDAAPFRGPLAWEDGQFVGTTLAVDDETDWASVAADRWPGLILADPALPAPPAPPRTRVLRERAVLIEADAAGDLLAAAGMRDVVLRSDGALRECLTARGFQVLAARQDDRPVAFIHDEGGPAPEAKPGDLVILLRGPGGDVATRARAAGVTVAPLALGAAVAARVARLDAAATTLQQRDAVRELDGLRLIGPCGVRQGDEVVVDDIDVPTRIIDPGAHDPERAASVLGAARAAALLTGRGRL